MNDDDDADDDEKGMSASRYPAMPSLVALQQMRNRLHLAHLGKKLMKWTAQATVRELRRLGQDINLQYEDFKDEISNAFILLARSRYYKPILNKIVLENVPQSASLHINTTTRSVSGVKIYVLEVVESEEAPYSFLGLEKGGQSIAETKKVWRDLLIKMVHITELRKGFEDVDAANKTATKRCNIIKRMLIPKLKKTIAYILSELEEREREETFRIKQFKKLKERHKKKEAKTKGKVHLCSCCQAMLEKDKQKIEDALSETRKVLESSKTFDEIYTGPCHLEDDKVDIKECLEPLANHIAEVICLSKICAQEGLLSESMERFIETCYAVKEKIENAGDILPVCEVCKQAMQKSERVEIPQPVVETPKSGKSIVSVDTDKKTEEPTDSIYNLGSESAHKFGYFEKKFKEIIKVTRLQNDDGTISEEKQVITIRTERRNPKKPCAGSCGGRPNDDPYLGPGGYDGDSGKNFRFARNTKSEHKGHSNSMEEPKLRTCMSAGFQKPPNDSTTNRKPQNDASINYDASNSCSVKCSQLTLDKNSSHSCGPRTVSYGSKPASQVTSRTSISVTKSFIPPCKSTSSAQTCCRDILVQKPEGQNSSRACGQKTVSYGSKPASLVTSQTSISMTKSYLPPCKSTSSAQTCCKEIPVQKPEAKNSSHSCGPKIVSYESKPASQVASQTCCKEIPVQKPVQQCNPCCLTSCNGDAVEPKKSEDKKQVCLETTGTDALWRDAFTSTTELDVEPSRLPNTTQSTASCRSNCGKESKEPPPPVEKPVIKCKIKILPKAPEPEPEKICCPVPSKPKPDKICCPVPDKPKLDKICCSAPSVKEENTNQEKQIVLRGSLVDILKSLVLPTSKLTENSTTKVSFTDPDKPKLICKSCISKLSSYVAKQDLDRSTANSSSSSCKICQASIESNEQEVSSCCSYGLEQDASSPSLSCKSLGIGSSSTQLKCCQPVEEPPCCEEEKEIHEQPHKCCIDEDKKKDSEGPSCCSMAAKLSSKSTGCPKSKSSINKGSLSHQSNQSKCSETKDVATCTKRSDKFDVRPFRNIKQSCPKKDPTKQACTCLSEPTLGSDRAHPLFKKSKSCCENENYYFRW